MGIGIRVLLLLVSCLGASAATAPPHRMAVPRLVPGAEDGAFRAWGDLDGDGDVDLVHFTYSLPLPWSGTTTYLNDGAGGFAPGAFQAFAAPISPSANRVALLRPRAGDVDGDGNVDLVLSLKDKGGAGVDGLAVLHGDGSGGFPSVTVVPTLGEVTGFVLGRLDADNALEIGVRERHASFVTVRWFDHAGGAFTPTGALVLTPAGGSSLSEMIEFVALDADGDGDDDLVGPDASGSTLRVVLSNAGLPIAGPLLSLPPTFPTGQPVAGDLDADGDADLLLAFTVGTSFRILSVAASGSGLVVGNSQSFSLSPLPATALPRLALADWDGDGDADLSLLGDVAFQFECSAGVSFLPPARIHLGSWPFEGGRADLDGDGLVDLVGASTWLPSDGTFVDLQVGAGSLPVGELAEESFRAVDDDGDGDVDVVAAGDGTVGVNDGAGSFEVVQLLPTPAAGTVWGSVVGRGDVNGDGSADLLVRRLNGQFPFAHQSTRLLERTPAGGWADSKEATSDPLATVWMMESTEHPLGDVDGDGDLDLLLSGGYRPNDGAGSFPTFVAAWSSRPIATSDVDLDGDLDFAAQDDGPFPWVARLGVQGPTSFVESSLPIGASQLPFRARFLDLDQDGDDDLIVDGSALSSGADRLENQAGSFVPLPPLVVDVTPGPSLVATDFDGDGIRDLVGLRRVKPPTVSSVDALAGVVFLRGLSTPHTYATPEAYLVRDPHGLLDADGDGDVDVLAGRLIENLTTVEPTSGAVRQYGVGAAGSGGATPLLGAAGPVAPSSGSASLRLRRVLGGAPSGLLIGSQEVSVPGFPVPGVTLLVGGAPLTLVILPPVGTPGAPGDGALDVPFDVTPILAGARLFLQAFVQDPASPAGLVAASNGLEIRFGS